MQEEYEKGVATVTASVLNVRAGQGVETQVLTQVQNQEYEITRPKMDGIGAGRRSPAGYPGIISVTTYSYAETEEKQKSESKKQTIVQETQKVQEASAQSIVQNQAA